MRNPLLTRRSATGELDDTRVENAQALERTDVLSPAEEQVGPVRQRDDRRPARARFAEPTEALGPSDAAAGPATRGGLGPRPRSSVLASLGLILGLLALVAVLTGVLAKAGVVAGVVGAILSAGGLAATTRRYVAGRFDAVLGLVLAGAAVVLGTLAAAGKLPWLTTDTDHVMRAHEWLHDRWQWVLSLRS